jgi:hypothetical protein
MNETTFDIKAVRAEQAAIRARARELEAVTNQALRDQLRGLALSLAGVRDVQSLLDDLRTFLDDE